MDNGHELVQQLVHELDTIPVYYVLFIVSYMCNDGLQFVS